METKTVDVGAGGAFAVVSRYRFQLDNHLGSASLEVDESGLVIGYEEYHPYGTTAYASGRSGVEVSGRRYRYTGKERDEDTGLCYYGARHIAPWLGRWTSADPVGMVDGPVLYAYVRNNPIRLVDLNGTDSNPHGFTEEQIAAFKRPVHIPKGARVGWLNQPGHKGGTYIKGATGGIGRPLKPRIAPSPQALLRRRSVLVDRATPMSRRGLALTTGRMAREPVTPRERAKVRGPRGR